jgi:hypothetical protein
MSLTYLPPSKSNTFADRPLRRRRLQTRLSSSNPAHHFSPDEPLCRGSNSQSKDEPTSRRRRPLRQAWALASDSYKHMGVVPPRKLTRGRRVWSTKRGWHPCQVLPRRFSWAMSDAN